MPEFWSRRGWRAWLLLPLSLLYYLLSAVRRLGFRLGLLGSWQAPVATVVVGNITVGGSGKTPLTIALVKALEARGIKCGVVSRGYRGGERGKKVTEPLLLKCTTPAVVAGDEPVLIAESTGVPVCVFPKRAQAVKALLAENPVDVVVCDDGLQHYALARDIEIAVINTDTAFGNRWHLPAGPLREPLSRLETVDYIVRNEPSIALKDGQQNKSASQDFNSGTRTFAYRLEVAALCRLDGAQRIECTDEGIHQQLAKQFSGAKLIAMPGIANPLRFFSYLETLDLPFEKQPKPDHYQFLGEDFNLDPEAIYLLTEKDKVKCQALPVDTSRIWYTETAATMDPEFENTFVDHVQDIIKKKQQSLT